MLEHYRKIVLTDERDNVAIVASEEGIANGEKVSQVLFAKENIGMGNKIAIRDIKKGDGIYRYGSIIGYSVKDIYAGEMVDNSGIIESEDKRVSDNGFIQIKEKNVSYGDRYFMGFRNEDGSCGTKNLLGITATVQCVEGVINAAVKKIEDELIANYPNVDGVMAVNHDYGCGVAIDAPYSYIPIQTIRNLALHPNFGGEILIVSLGCEKLTPKRLMPDLDADNLIILQDHAGFFESVEIIVKKARERLIRLNKRKKVKCSIKELVVGVQCGGSDVFSGITSNPAVGHAVDLLIKSGATVLFSEVTEVMDGMPMLISRAANESVARKLDYQIQWYREYLKKLGADRSANPTPGNKEGGISNITEKALGSIIKSGTTQIVDVLEPGQRAEKKGLIFAVTPASDFICGTLQMASGVTVQIFTTGRGTPYGLKMIPVIKVSSNSRLAKMWPDLIDIDAGEILKYNESIESVGIKIFDYLIKVASREEITAADKAGIENAICLFDPNPVT